MTTQLHGRHGSALRPVLRRFGDSAMRARLFHLVLGLMALLSWLSPALAQHPIPEAERWATITHAGNAPHIAPANKDGFPTVFGQVNYEYQISRTEVTALDWLDYVRSYSPYMQSGQLATSFLGMQIIPHVVAPGVFEYTLSASRENEPVEVSWRHAARLTCLTFSYQSE